MKNMEQIRAAQAIRAVQAFEPNNSLSKSAINKLPAMILTNGLLATIAFVKSDSSGAGRSDMAKAMLKTAEHLYDLRMISQEASVSLDAFIEYLCSKKSSELQLATTESLAFIGYLRRFAKKEN